MIDCPPLLAISAKSQPSQYGHADYHWRVQRPLARLRERGVDAAECWLDADERPTVSPEGRVVVLQRVVKGGGEDEVRSWVRSLRDAGALAVVFEIDDDEISTACIDWMEAAGGLESVGRVRLERERQALTWTLQACDAVTVSTEPLAVVVRQYTDKPVIVVPNAIDVDWFRARLGERPTWADHLTIGWAGGRRPDADLEPMAVAWGRIARRYPAVRFAVCGWQPDCIYREVEDIDRIIRVPWRDIERYPQVMQVDIGCTPLADTPFNRCKSPIKAWEYGMAGAAVVSSPTVYMDEVAAGANVWLAETANDWEALLALLIENGSLRQRTADGLNAHVLAHHSLVGNLDVWIEECADIAHVTGLLYGRPGRARSMGVMRA